MKLLTQTFPQVRRLFGQGGWFSPLLIASVLALEVLGRQAANDFYDTVGAASLVLLIAIAAIRHRLAPLGWVKYVGRQVWKLARFADRFKIEFGPDLRGTPPIPPRLPFSVHLTVALLAAWTAVAFALWNYLPNSWRSYAVQGSYTLYLMGVMGLWGLLFAGLFGGIYFPFMIFNFLFPRQDNRSGEPKISNGQVLFLVGYALTICFAWRVLPLWLVPVSCGATLVGVSLLAIWPRRTDVQFIWRATGSRRVWSVTTPRLLWITTTLATLLLAAATVTAAGGRIMGREGIDGDMPITVMLGVAVAWLTPGILLSAAVLVFVLWRHNPSRPCSPSIHIGGDLAAAVRPTITRRLREWGWEASFDPGAASEVSVRIRLVEPAHSQASEFDPVWPLCVSLDDLKEAALRDRLERRDEIQKRRLSLRGLQRIFKHAKSRQFSGGSGFWLAPHLWFMPGLARDEMEEDREDAAFLATTVGPPFHDVLHRHVRQYLYRILRALQVDLIYIEDGIDFRKLKKVLRVLFEVFDKSAGKRRAEEIHFQGLPSIKVLIHDFQLDEPFRSEKYPEPRFDDLGRARILHVFRDRGENEEYVDPPFDYSYTPEPLFA